MNLNDRKELIGWFYSNYCGMRPADFVQWVDEIANQPFVTHWPIEVIHMAEEILTLAEDRYGAEWQSSTSEDRPSVRNNAILATIRQLYRERNKPIHQFYRERNKRGS